MLISQVTFTSKNKKCLSLVVKRYLINTVDKEEALEVATELLNKEKHSDLYAALPIIIVDVHNTKED